MKKKFAAFVLCVICLLSAAGCGQTKTDEQTPPAADQSTTTDDYLTGIGGTYVELFPELSKSEYRNIWIDATAPLVGAENAEATTDLLLGMCMAEPYGPEAVEKYEADPDSMAFNCYFLGGIDKFVMDGHTITGLDAQVDALHHLLEGKAVGDRLQDESGAHAVSLQDSTLRLMGSSSRYSIASRLPIRARIQAIEPAVSRWLRVTARAAPMPSSVDSSSAITTIVQDMPRAAIQAGNR